MDDATDWEIEDLTNVQDGVGTGRKITDLSGNGAGTWSPDGTRFAYGRYVGGGVPQFVLTDPDGSDTVILPPAILGPQTWSPDGLRLFGYAYAEGGTDETSIVVVDIASGTATIVAPVSIPADQIAGDGSWQRLAD